MKKTLVGNVWNGRQHGLSILDGWVDPTGQLNHLNTTLDMTNPTNELGVMVVTFQWTLLDNEYDPADGDEFQWSYDMSVRIWKQGVPLKIMP